MNITGTVKSNELTGSYAVWDSGNPKPFEDLAGGQYLRTEGSNAVIVTKNGVEMPVLEGWVVIKTGKGRIFFVTPENVGEDSLWSVTSG